MPLTLSVIGTGYLGVVHAACMADLGHTVTAVDTDAAKVQSLANGRPPIYEPGLEALLERTLATGRLRFTTDYAELADATVHFICVGTPQRRGENAADTSYVFSAAQSLAPHLRSTALVVGKSTVPVGTAARLHERLVTGAPVGTSVRLAWNPEFLREGFAIEDTVAPDRLVYGVRGPSTEADVALLDEVYAGPLASGTPRIVTDFATAELVKASANAFLATKISFINAMAEVCEAAGADVVQLADAIGHDDRIGRKFLNAGVGFGGGCLPKDIRAFMARAGELGADQALTFLREVDAINLRRRSRMVELAREQCGGTLRGKRVAVLGAAFKPNSDDIRDSPALDVAEGARLAGALVMVHDPKAIPVARRLHPELAYAETVEEACRDADVVLHLTEWSLYREIDPAQLASVVTHRAVIDGRNALDPALWRAAGWTYRALGRPAPAESPDLAHTRAVNDPKVVRRVLTTPATWAVVGLSADTSRTAYGVARWMKDALGHRVIPVHPRAAQVWGERAYRSLADLPDGTTVAVVDCFVNSSRVGAVVDEAIAQRDRLGIVTVWLQLGVVDEAAAARALDAGLDVVMDTCPMIEYPRL